jgi:hypothetical protein
MYIEQNGKVTMLIDRQSTETWRDALARVANRHGCAWEVLRLYDQLVNSGHKPPEAVRRAVRDYYSQL